MISLPGTRDHDDRTERSRWPEYATGFRELLIQAGLYHDPKKQMTRNTKSLRVTGICLQLDRNPDASWRHFEDWCRTSERQLRECYNQLHPEASAAHIAGKGNRPKVIGPWGEGWVIPSFFPRVTYSPSELLKRTFNRD